MLLLLETLSEANNEWISAHLKRSRCWEQVDSPDPASALPLPRKAFSPHPASASSSPHCSLFNHLYWIVQHHIITPKLLPRFLYSRPPPQLCLIPASQALPTFVIILLQFLQSQSTAIPLLQVSNYPRVLTELCLYLIDYALLVYIHIEKKFFISLNLARILGRC